MAEETESNSNKSSDVIDLEGLVRDMDSGAPEGPIHAEQLSVDEIDNILMEEDPALAAQIEAIREVGKQKPEEVSGSNVETIVDPLSDPSLAGSLSTTPRQKVLFFLLKIGSRLRSVKALFRRSLTDSKGLLTELRIRFFIDFKSKAQNLKEIFRQIFSWWRARTGQQKASLFFALVALAALTWVSARTLHGSLLPKVEKVWVASFSDLADEVFTYDPAGAFENFNDPLLHPEFVVIVERIVVNLKRTPEAADGSFPMAAFELYLQTDNQEAAVEVKDRNVEIRDAISRSVERVTYADLAGEEGKTKLKLLIRKDLNTLLTRGKVRRVFFKTLVLNPES